MPRRWLLALASIALVGCGPRVLLRAHPTLGAIYEFRDAEQQRCAGHAPEVFRHVTRWEVTALGDDGTFSLARREDELFGPSALATTIVVDAHTATISAPAAEQVFRVVGEAGWPEGAIGVGDSWERRGEWTPKNGRRFLFSTRYRVIAIEGSPPETVVLESRSTSFDGHAGAPSTTRVSVADAMVYDARSASRASDCELRTHRARRRVTATEP